MQTSSVLLATDSSGTNFLDHMVAGSNLNVIWSACPRSLSWIALLMTRPAPNEQHERERDPSECLSLHV
jgi:hypothetical protein